MVANAPGLKCAPETVLRRTSLDADARDLDALDAPIGERCPARRPQRQVEMLSPRPAQGQLDAYRLRCRDRLAALRAGAGEGRAGVEGERSGYVGVSAFRTMVRTAVDTYVNGLARIDKAVRLRAVGGPEEAARAQLD